ncbi:MAG: hypothetical protein JWQ29_3248 [Phenylobacterium sp.]|nr:hypothetical protein [Phenylobacterium sp.]
MDRRIFVASGVGIAALALAPATAAAALKSKGKAMTNDLTPDEVKALVRKWFLLYEEKKIDEHNAMIHPDAVAVYPEMLYLNPETSMGMSALKKTLESDGRNFVDLKMRIDNMWAVGNTAFVEGYFIGSKLAGALAKIARGTNSKVPYLHRVEVQDRKIKLVHSYYDTALFYQVQLGLEGPTREQPIAPWMKALAAEAKAHAG